ncbi:MAG: hypothetical protein WB783_18690 [Arenicellales bacterium]
MYDIEFYLSIIKVVNTDTPLVTLDVYDNSNDRILVIEDILEATYLGVVRRYVLLCECSRYQRVEFRVYWHGTCDVEVEKVVVRPARVRLLIGENELG